MTPIRRTVTFRIDDDLIDGLQLVWERDGVPVSEQLRRAVQDWLEKKGVKLKAERKRAATRKRS
jgi:Ribbon-helix-helix protein, copG family